MKRKNASLREKIRKHYERMAAYVRMDSAWLDCDPVAKSRASEVTSYYRMVNHVRD